MNEKTGELHWLAITGLILGMFIGSPLAIFGNSYIGVAIGLLGLIMFLFGITRKMYE